jgi:hypothetical protein
MAGWRRGVTFGLVLLVGVLYSATLFRNMRESERRSLQLKETPVAADHVAVSVQVVSINPATSQMTARIGFRLNGDLAKDPVTPAVDLTLLLNQISGPQEIVFPRGRRINSIEAVFPLDGNANHYPFDRYGSSIRIMVTKKAIVVRRPTARMDETIPNTTLDDDAIGGLLVAAPQESEPLPIKSDITASIPGIKFEGKRVELAQGMEGFDLVVRRADNVIVVSVLVMVLMMSLALSVLLMSLRALTSDEKIELLPLSLCVSLLFGLPALRNAQPAVPSLGVLGDYLSFIWAEMVVAVSAVMLIWTWLIRQHHSTESSPQ